MKTHLQAFAIAALCVSSVAGCSGSDPDASETSSDAVTGASKFRLDKSAPPSAADGFGTFCDKHGVLELSTSPARATIRETLIGGCEILVEPNVRSYTSLTGTADGCGTTTYTGSTSNANGSYTVSIEDNRGRRCEDYRPAKVIVRETVPGGATITRYASSASGTATPRPPANLKISPSADVIACNAGRKFGGSQLLVVKKSAKVVHFENSGGGNEDNAITATSGAENRLTIKIDSSSGPETVVVDLAAGSAKWSEDSTRSGQEFVYPTCKGFATYDAGAISDWVRSQRQ